MRPGGQVQLIGNKLKVFGAFGIVITDDPDHYPGGTAGQDILDDAGVFRGRTIKVQYTGGFQTQVLLGSGHEIDAQAVFPLMPLAEIDAGAIPDPKHLDALGSTLTERGFVQAFEGVDIVFLFVRALVGQGHVEQPLGSKVHPEEVPNSGSTLRKSGVMAGGGMPVTVAGEDFETLQSGKPGEGVRQIGLENRGDELANLVQQFETSGAMQ